MNYTVGIYRDGTKKNEGKVGMKPKLIDDNTKPPFVCEKHKEVKYYDTFYRKWECESCWAEAHKKAVIYQLKPIRRKIR